MAHGVDAGKFRKRSDLLSLVAVSAHVAFVLAPVYLAVVWASGPPSVRLMNWNLPSG